MSLAQTLVRNGTIKSTREFGLWLQSELRHVTLTRLDVLNLFGYYTLRLQTDDDPPGGLPEAADRKPQQGTGPANDGAVEEFDPEKAMRESDGIAPGD
jgi:hypothetical protein